MEKRKNNYLKTYMGNRVDPLDVKAEDITLEDIAHALSLMCRGNGQVVHFYSVGQHCINCAKEAKARGWNERLQLGCLLHDAAEAYMSDLITPIKVHMPQYYDIEDNFYRIPEFEEVEEVYSKELESLFRKPIKYVNNVVFQIIKLTRKRKEGEEE